MTEAIARTLTDSAVSDAARHASAVAELSEAVASELGLDANGLREVKLVALLHDVGKVQTPPALLDKPGPLSAREREEIERHTVHGQRLVERTDPSLTGIAGAIRACHERWDGTGYPDRLAGHDIPLSARIVFCCDAFDVMTSDRAYRPALGERRARGELLAGAATQFDPTVVRALLRVLGARAGAGEAAGDSERVPPLAIAR
ncbi:MAG: HD-GYP domain-containing protein [Thermoleophilaceae bacterium]